MATIPQYYSDYIFINEFLRDLPTPLTGSGSSSSEMHSEETVPFFDNGVQLNLSFDSDITSSIPMPSLPERHVAVSDAAVAALFPAHEKGLFAMSGAEGIVTGRRHYHHEACDCGEECCGVISNFWPVYPMTVDNWEIQAGVWQKDEEPTRKIARYSAEERKDRILRYLKKRSQRNFNKTIKYACRKTLADKRVRVRGRFAKNSNELCEDETIMINTDHKFQDSMDLYFRDPLLEMRAHDEEWFQDAVSNFMYWNMLPDNVMEFPYKIPHGLGIPDQMSS